METNYSLEYLELLSKDYPTIRAVSAEIINLQAILNLPKGTEHFVSDLHGEHEAFLHVLRNASGVIKTKIDEISESIKNVTDIDDKYETRFLSIEKDIEDIKSLLTTIASNLTVNNELNATCTMSLEENDNEDLIRA